MERWNNLRPSTRYILIGIGVIFVFGLLTPDAPVKTDDTAVVEEVKVERPTYIRPESGSNIVASKDMIIVTEKDDYDKVMDTIETKDNYGLMELITADKLTYVSKGTELLVIDSSITMEKVRVLSGDIAGRSGWVPFEMVSQ